MSILIDVNDGLKRVMNNEKLYAKLLTKFKEDTSLKKMEDSLAAGNFEEAKNAIHTLKGLAANLSLIELHKQTVEIEHQAKVKDINPNQIDAVKNVFSLTLVEIDKVIAQYA